MSNTKNVFGKKTTKITKFKSTAPLSNLDQKLLDLRKYNEEHHTHLSYGQYSARLYWETFGKKKQG